MCMDLVAQLNTYTKMKFNLHMPLKVQFHELILIIQLIRKLKYMSFLYGRDWLYICDDVKKSYSIFFSFINI